MIQFRNHFYSGFFERGMFDSIIVDRLVFETIKYDDCLFIPSSEENYDLCPYIDSDGTIFLDGSCNLFAKMLNQIFDYPVYEVSDGAACHWFAMTEYKDEKIYVDVRGATSDFDLFFNRYSFVNNRNNPEPQRMTDFRFKNETWRETGEIFALSIISENMSYYGEFEK